VASQYPGKPSPYQGAEQNWLLMMLSGRANVLIEKQEK